jgi:hypothetical protein
MSRNGLGGKGYAIVPEAILAAQLELGSVT